MRRLAPIVLTAAAVLVPASPPASAAQAACDFVDTPSFTNTAYTDGPGLHRIGASTEGPLYAYTHVDASEGFSGWSRSTDRVNGAHHVLWPGDWTVTWEWDTGSEGAWASGAAQLVTRFGGQVEQFTGDADVHFQGWSIEPDNPSGEFVPVVPPAQGEFAAFTVPDGSSAEMDALFYVDAHVQRSPGVEAWAEVAWTGLSICWRNGGNAAGPALGLKKQAVDPVTCPVLATLAGAYGPVTVTPEGDVAAGPVTWDCPPYAA